MKRRTIAGPNSTLKEKGYFRGILTGYFGNTTGKAFAATPPWSLYHRRVEKNSTAWRNRRHRVCTPSSLGPLSSEFFLNALELCVVQFIRGWRLLRTFRSSLLCRCTTCAATCAASAIALLKRRNLAQVLGVFVSGCMLQLTHIPGTYIVSCQDSSLGTRFAKVALAHVS